MIKITSYNSLLTILILSITMLSCSEGSFTKVVDLGIEDVDNQLAVIAKMESDSESNLILVSETLSVLDTSKFQSLDNAEVKLMTPDKGEISWTFDPDYNLYNRDSFEFIPGETYSLEVNHPAHTSMTAEVKVPNAPELINLEHSLTGSSIPGQRAIHTITLKFKDPPDEENNYMFRGKMNSIITETGEEFTADFQFDLSNNILDFNEDVVSDITFDGNEHELILLGSLTSFISQNTTALSIEIDVISLSSDIVLYERSVQQAYDAVGNPFVEPSTIYSNFDNGFGIFTVDVIETIKLDL